MDLEEARNRARTHLIDTQSVACAIVDALTEETHAAWLFVWNSQEALESHGARGRLRDVGRICVRKRTGEVRMLRKDRSQARVDAEPMDDTRSRPGAQAVVERALEALWFESDLAVIPSSTRETPKLWVFHAQWERFVRTGDRRDALVGLGPVVVEKASGRVHVLGSAATDKDIAAIERRAR